MYYKYFIKYNHWRADNSITLRWIFIKWRTAFPYAYMYAYQVSMNGSKPILRYRSGHTDGRTDGRTNRWMDNAISISPFQLRWREIKIFDRTVWYYDRYVKLPVFIQTDTIQRCTIGVIGILYLLHHNYVVFYMNFSMNPFKYLQGVKKKEIGCRDPLRVQDAYQNE